MIRLFWAKCNNFGDELSPYLISKLSGQKVIYRRNFSLEKFVADVLRFIKSLIIRRKLELDCLKYSFSKKVILAIGSVINESTSQCIVWGSGIISKNTIIKGGQFFAVRGEKTKKRLVELGFNSPEVLGDPALLLPIVYPNSKIIVGNKIGIIPHINDYDEIYNLYKNFENLKIINLGTVNVEFVLNQIFECNIVISTSLHGVIVSHAYNIPALHFALNPLIGDGVKFEDYYSSVNIPPYKSFNLKEIDLSNEYTIKEFFIIHKDCALPDLKFLKRNQINLIKVAPFFVKEKYRFFNE